jgi:hypothetical protein
MEWTVPVPRLFVRFAPSPGKPIACPERAYIGLTHALPCRQRTGEPRGAPRSLLWRTSSPGRLLSKLGNIPRCDIVGRETDSERDMR